MKTNYVSGIYLLTGLLASGAAAAPSTTPDLAPTLPVSSAVAPTGLVPPPDQIVTTAELPSVTDLTDRAALQGITIEQIATSAIQTTVVYRYPDGKTKVVAYQLPQIGSAESLAPLAAKPGPAMVYDPPLVPPAIIYDYDPVYPAYPSYGYSPFAFRFNFESGRRHWR